VVTGRVPEEFQLQVAGPSAADPRISIQVVPFGSNAVLVKMNVPKSLRHGKIILPVAMRTNSEKFSLLAKVTDPSRNAFISASHARAMGDGALLIPGAAEAFSPQMTQAGSGSIIASGTRISRRGNGLTPNNALIADLEVSLDGKSDESHDEFSFVISMERL
jgi:hypothetical protein